MKKDNVQTAYSLPAPAKGVAPKAPNYMVFVCSLDRADKAARKDPARLARFQQLRTEAIAAYKAKDYPAAIRLHTEAHGVAAGEIAVPAIEGAAPATAEVAEVAAAGSPRPPKANGGKASGKKATAPKATSKPAPKPAPKQATEKAAKPAKPAKAVSPKKLSAMGAAAQVLAASKEPLNVKQIIAAMSEQGLWTSPGGKTPHATLAAALQRDIAAKGRESKFKKADRGLFIASGR